MSSYQDQYDEWIASDMLLPDLKDDLLSIEGDDEEKEDRFYQYVSFGTGGMRGLLGAGTNRINTFTIRRVAEGLALYIKSAGEEAVKRGLAIAYDTRHFSKEFALETAKILGKHGIRSYVFEESRPTPELSFAVRYFSTFAGVVITASHNPKEYNGFKVYGEDGGQLTPECANKIVRFMDGIESVFSIETVEVETMIESGILTYVLDEVDEAYQESLLTLRETGQLENELKIVYTPLHGAGLVPVVEGLKRFGFQNVYVVQAQAVQDPQFPTVTYPNPEEHESFKFAIQLGKNEKADILIATDPDADRLGVAARKQDGEYELLTGNQLGALLLHYILEQKKQQGTLPANGVALKTIVTSELGRAIAFKYDVAVIDTLTGFKFISEKIEEFERSGEYKFLFGYEESYGYLIGDFVRDKDAVQAALITAEMAASHKRQGKTLYDALGILFDEFGHYHEALKSITLDGIEGREKIGGIMKEFREHPPESIADIPVKSIEDYQKRTRTQRDGFITQLELPESDVIKLILEDGSWICIRPSGTEPKCKFYFGVCKDSAEDAEALLRDLGESLMKCIGIVKPS